MPDNSFRLICNLLPVGPRKDLVGNPGERWFSLQIAGGYETDPLADDPDDSEKYETWARAALAWNLISDASGIHVGYYEDDSGAPLFKSITVPIVRLGAGSPQTLQAAFVTQYIVDDNRRVDLSWAPPSYVDSGHNDDDADFVDDHDRQASHRLRLVDLALYLSTLPPEVSRRLDSALFFKLDVSELNLHPDKPYLIAAPELNLDVPAPTTLRSPNAAVDPFLGFDPDDFDSAKHAVWPYLEITDALSVEAYIAPLIWNQRLIPDENRNNQLALDFETLWIDRVESVASQPLLGLDEKLEPVLDPVGVMLSVPPAMLEDLGIQPGGPGYETWNAFLLACLSADVHPLTTPRNISSAQIEQLLANLDRDSTDLPTVNDLIMVLEQCFSGNDTALIKRKHWQAIVQRAAAIAGNDLELLTAIRKRNAAGDVAEGRVEVLRQTFIEAVDRYIENQWPNDEHPVLRGRLDNFRSDIASLPADQTSRIFATRGFSFARQLRILRVRELLRETASSGDFAPSELRLKATEYLRNALVEVSNGYLVPRQGVSEDWLDKIRNLLTDAENSKFIQAYVDSFDAVADNPIEHEALPSGLVYRYGIPESTQGGEATVPDEAVRQIAGVGMLLQRRTADDPDYPDKWRLANAGKIVGPGASEITPADEPVLVPLRVSYGNDLSRPEQAYDSAVLGVRDPRGKAMTVQGASDEEAGDDLTFADIDLYRYLPFPPQADLKFDRLKPPPLRFGDEYSAALFAIGSAGGLPDALTGVGSGDTDATPDRLNLDYLDSNGLNPPNPSEFKRYRRRVSISEVSLFPLPVTQLREDLLERRQPTGEWPPQPPDVRLLVSDLMMRDESDRFALTDQDGDTPNPATENMPVMPNTGNTVLLSVDGEHAARGAPARHEFSVMPPTTRERVVTAWDMPLFASDVAEKQVFLNRVKDLSARLAVSRSHAMRYAESRPNKNDTPPQDTFDFPTRDPAVVGIGVRLFEFAPEHGTNGRRWGPAPQPLRARILTLVADGPDDAEYYRAEPIGVQVAALSDGSEATLEEIGGQFVAGVAPGKPILLEFHPIVRLNDLNERFDENTLRLMFADHRREDWDQANGNVPEWEDHIDHGPLWFLPGELVAYEVVSEKMPTEQSLWQALSVKAQDKSVQVHVDTGIAADQGGILIDYLDNVAEVTVRRQHWVWRGRPLGARDPADENGGYVTDEQGRPPQSLYGFSGGTPDNDVKVARWETILGLGEGFVDHICAPTQWDFINWNLAPGRPKVHADARADRAGADYHRYAVKLRSRYAGVIDRKKSTVDSRGANVLTVGGERMEAWRRVLIEFGGMKPPAPVVLATLPLTKGLASSPYSVDARPETQIAAPVLVICDHVPFVPYGLEERLLAELRADIVDGEFDPAEVSKPGGDADSGSPAEYEIPTDLRPFRVGPVGDVYSIDEVNKEYWGDAFTRPGRLDVWGPFGLTFETIAEEARPAACAYVVFPPEESGPHWIAEVSFKRAVFGYEQTDEEIEFSERAGMISDGVSPHQLVFMGKSDLPDINDDLISLGTMNRQGELSIGTEGGVNLPPLHPTASEFNSLMSHAAFRYCILVSQMNTDGITAVRVPYPVMLYRIKPSAGQVECLPFKAAAPSLEPDDQLIAHILEIRTDSRRPEGETEGDWIFDEPNRSDNEVSISDFWKRLFPSQIYSSMNIQQDPQQWRRREALDLPDAAGRIERIIGPYRIDIDMTG